MNRYVTDRFDSQSFHTIGVEFLNRDLEVDGRLVTLQIWDTAAFPRLRVSCASLTVWVLKFSADCEVAGAPSLLP
ncbi:Ras- protein Rab-9B [Ameca splendens]